MLRDNLGMSGLDIVAAVAGITDVTLRSLIATYNFIHDIKDAPAAISQIRTELGAVVQALSGLSSLQNAKEDVRDQVTRVGLQDAVSQCEASCSKLKKDLTKWTKSKDGLAVRLQFLRHREQVKDCLAQIERAKMTITMPIGIAMLATSAQGSLSSADIKRDPQVDSIRRETEAVPRLAENQIHDADTVEAQLRSIEASDDVDAAEDAEAALKFVEQRRAASQQLWANTVAAAHETDRLLRLISRLATSSSSKSEM